MVRPERRRADGLRQFGGELGVRGRERHRGRQTARHVGGKARPRQNRGHRARRAFGDHFAHEFLAAALDALGADDHRRARGDERRKRLGHGAHRLGGNDEEQRVRAGGPADVVRDGDTVIEPHAGQEATLALRLQRVRIGGDPAPTA